MENKIIHKQRLVYPDYNVINEHTLCFVGRGHYIAFNDHIDGVSTPHIFKGYVKHGIQKEYKIHEKSYKIYHIKHNLSSGLSFDSIHGPEILFNTL